jgi:tRNA threonylcarbamoyladenosine biosynthesis protein TsaB
MWLRTRLRDTNALNSFFGNDRERVSVTFVPALDHGHSAAFGCGDAALRPSWLLSVRTMVVLALDTTTSAGSCALLRDDRVVREQASDQSRPQASRLPGELAAMLAREGVALPEVDILAVGIGPGSFTGLRVGIATMQGLAMALNRPLFGISGFDALASLACGGSGANNEPDPPHVHPNARLDPPHRSVATWVDAWRGEVYAALYQNGREIEPPTVDLPQHLLQTFVGRPMLFTGDGAAIYRATVSAALGSHAEFTEPVAPLLAGAMATLAVRKFRAGQRPLPHAIRPLYVRRSDAELARDRS